MAQLINIKLDLDALRLKARTAIWKWGQVNQDDANYQRIYHMQHSDDDNVDLNLLSLYVRQRAERIADLVSEYLTDIVYGNDIHEPINVPEPSPYEPQQRGTTATYIEYDLTLPAGWNANTYYPLAQHFEDYVMNGAIADWFTDIGEKQGAVYEQQAVNNSTEIIRNIYKKNSTI